MRNKKFNILVATIDQDQDAVANQWTDTFIHNPPDDVAIQMTQLLTACVAVGDFKTRAFLSKSPEFQAPSDKLTVIDYLSHASRIILDYEKLTGTNKDELLQFFPEPQANGVVARSATHDVSRKAGKIVEGKDILLGLAGQLPAIVKTPRDFGVNIAMGGDGQTNFYGKKISANGYSGHFYFHRNDADNLLLLGLEQSAPATAMELVFGAPVYGDNIQHGHDQFDQGHSLIGASDTYTAAGSLYFSDPIYQAKLLLEKDCFPPDKYEGMQVTITDQNWPQIKQFLAGLQQAASEGSRSKLLNELKKKPLTAKPVVDVPLSYVALNFDNYLKQIFKQFINSSHLDLKERELIQQKQLELLTTIKALQKGEFLKYDTFLEQIKGLSQVKIPAYQHAIKRIEALFELQKKNDPNLQQTHEKVLLERQYEELKIENQQLLEKLLQIKHYYQAIFIEKDAEIEQFIGQLEYQITILQNPHSLKAPKKDDLFGSWVQVSEQLPVTPELVDEIQQCIAQPELLLDAVPKLYSETVVKRLEQKLKEEVSEKNFLNVKLHSQQIELETSESKIENLNLELAKTGEEISRLRQEVGELAKAREEINRLRQEARELEKSREKLCEQKPKQSSPGFPTMEVIGGFIAVLGAAAVAVAFTVLTITTFGAGALAAAGVCATLLGIGLFAAGAVKRCQSETIELDSPNKLV